MSAARNAHSFANEHCDQAFCPNDNLITSQFVQAIRTEFRLDWRGNSRVGHLGARYRQWTDDCRCERGQQAGRGVPLSFTTPAGRPTVVIMDTGSAPRRSPGQFRKSLMLGDDEFDLLIAAVEGIRMDRRTRI